MVCSWLFMVFIVLFMVLFRVFHGAQRRMLELCVHFFFLYVGVLFRFVLGFVSDFAVLGRCHPVTEAHPWSAAEGVETVFFHQPGFWGAYFL